MQNTPKPSTGYVRLNEELLRPGDIILVTQSSAISASIRLMTWSDISHAMVYVEDRSVIDATFAGVQASNTQRLWFESDRPVHVLRLKTSPTPDQLQAVRPLASAIFSARSALFMGLVSHARLGEARGMPIGVADQGAKPLFHIDLKSTLSLFGSENAARLNKIIELQKRCADSCCA